MKKIILLLLCSQVLMGQTADEIAHKYIITDGHVDLPYRLKVKNFRLEKEFIGIPVQSDNGDFDYVRAKKGGLDAPFMSIYIPAAYKQPEAKLLADSLINMVNFIADNNSDKFRVVSTPQEIEKAFKEGLISLPMGMENGSPIGSVEDVAYFRKRGISYVTLTHSKANQICDSSYDPERPWNGLSEFGEKVVNEMVKHGILIDISHVSDSTFYDVMKISPVPVIASHSSLRHFTPGFERNMNDEMVKEMKKNGGVIMVNFGSTFLDGEVATERKNYNENLIAAAKAKGIVDLESEEAKEFGIQYRKNNPEAFSDVKKVADHIDRIVRLAGINHVGFGSDYDGVGDSLPVGLKDVSDYPNLLAELLDRGYSEEDLALICSGNLFRVWNQVLEYSK